MGNIGEHGNKPPLEQQGCSPAVVDPLGGERISRPAGPRPLSPEDGTAPGTGVDATKRVKRQSGRAPSAIGRPINPVIVKQDQVFVTCKPDIELDPAAAQFPRLMQPRQGVLRCACGGATMTYHRWKLPGQSRSCHRAFAMVRCFAPKYRPLPSRAETARAREIPGSPARYCNRQ